MTDVNRLVTVETEGMTLSLLIWRRYRTPMFGLAERVHEINPGLAARGIVLPVGTTFLMPEQRETPQPAKIISLWS